MPKLEEIDDIDDIDNMEMDLAEFDSSLKTPIAPKIVPTVVRSQDQEEQSQPPIDTLFPNKKDRENEQISFINPETGEVEDAAAITKEELQQVKKFQIIYPCYFDKNRSHKEGRRVSAAYAVENPLAKTISDAVRYLGLASIFESDKTHPQDFGNPGRVRVYLKENGSVVASAFQFAKGGKRQLFIEIGKYLNQHPTTLQSTREIPYGPDYNEIELQKIPKVGGFKMNDIVPLHSPLMMGHPATKNLYDQPLPQVTKANENKPMKMPKNKFKVIRR